jgi:hypothetical protein
LREAWPMMWSWSNFKKPIPAGWDEQRKMMSGSAPCSEASFEQAAAIGGHRLDQKAAI